jgi:23S rRNA (guanosine2251-2'-O)-methyltransferase
MFYMKQPLPPILILHNIRSSHNVGSLFRTADAAGVGCVYLVGYTPAPLDKFGKASGDIAKAALGAEKTMPWKKIALCAPLIKKLQKDGYYVVAIEQDKKADDYKKIKTTKPIAFILGNEVTGISKSILDKAGAIAEIPMQGKKESLNVSVAGGVALFRILNL